MNSFKEKFKFLYLPFLLITVSFIIAYTALHWLLFIRWNAFSIAPQVPTIILPVILPLLPIVMVFRRRVKAIRFGINYRDTLAFQVLIWGTISITSIFLQVFLRASNAASIKIPYVPENVIQYFEQQPPLALLVGISALLSGAGFILFLLFFVRLDEWDVMRFRNGVKGKTDDEVSDILRLFIPQKAFYTTAIIIDLNLLLFLIMFFSGLGFKHFQTRDLFYWGGNYRPATISGEWWRLLTCTFLHGGVMHLLSNMVSLVFVATLVEPVLGRWKFGAVYLATGIIASAASIWWHPATVSIGASGAIFGIYGVFVSLLITKVFRKDFRRQFLRMTLVFIAYNVAMGFTGNIDNAAHIGGLVSGIIAGALLAPGIKKNITKQAIINSSTIETTRYYP